MKKLRIWIVASMSVMAATGCGNSSVAPNTNAPSLPVAVPSTSAPQPSPNFSHRQSITDTSDILSVLSVEHQLDLATQLDGVIVSIEKDEGSNVKTGDILGQLDDRSLQAQLAKARDDLEVSRNNEKYKDAELKAKNAALLRQQRLRSFGLSSEADLAQAEFEAQGAQYDLQSWHAVVDGGLVEVHRLEIELDGTKLRAPFSGVVVRRYVRQGQTLAKGDKCFRISQMSPLLVQFQIPESSPHRPELGAPVRLSPLGTSDRILSARVLKVSPTIDPASDSYDVTAQLTGPNLSGLSPGMAVRVFWPGAGSSQR